MSNFSVNKHILLGNLGADPETRYTPSNTPVTRIRLATSKNWKDRNTGERKEKTTWHNVVFFGRLAEVAGEYLKKGDTVYIEGESETRSWEDDNGNKRYMTETIANEMKMGGSAGGNKSRQGNSHEGRQEQSGQPAHASGGWDGEGSDIPFAQEQRGILM